VTGFDVTAVELQVCGLRLAQIGGEVRGRLEQVEREMDALLGAGWRGRASAGFADGWSHWRTGAHQVIDGLDRMSALLGATGRDYDAAEHRAQGTVERSGSAL
jgi:WXG100 family type VII secretion target